MIGESSSVSTLITSERLVRENQVQSRGGQDSPEEGLEQSYTDITSFSPQALALARNVAPAAEASTEQEQSQPQSRGQGGGQDLSARLLDILV
jgi:hypothetical protein